MSGSRPKPAEGHLAEQHLGDRLSALVDGELGHESRDRVLAHLATCAKCKAEADAQRRLKNVFAAAAPPSPSESFLARLQGLPGGGDEDGGVSPLSGGGLPGTSAGRMPAGGIFGVRRDEPFEFGYVPAGPHGSAVPAADRGFRIHPVGRPDADRAASRGMRFAFVAAGAVSLAAVALGGVTTGIPSGSGADARGGSGAGSNVTPARSQGGAAASAPETQRRRSAAPLLAQSTLLGQAPMPTSVSAPLLPGMQPPAAGRTPGTGHGLSAPVMAGAAVMSPLIRPLNTAAPISLASWSAAPEVRAPGPGLLAAPVPDSASAPTPTASPSYPARTAP
ncbi:anti-sigma factor family protein [Streptomyces olivochromogenes]|uniref:anti-sigma factor family protein n=1 Tax=Streptomyces olivochromogenes TaxID=1963 RepID=UPI001F3F06D3|nr:zf-HC2 domain-containing protein [Streptomyces olivochromogenes]MCF3136510.1 zf-HC2 domain-containing protein [Streptomyces olivochromogenes]